jgi:hypothetical protein
MYATANIITFQQKASLRHVALSDFSCGYNCSQALNVSVAHQQCPPLKVDNAHDLNHTGGDGDPDRCQIICASVGFQVDGRDMLWQLCHARCPQVANKGRL